MLLPASRRASRTLYPFILIPLLAIVLITGSLAAYFTNFAHAAPEAGPVAISGNVPALVAKSKIVGPASAQQQLSLSVALHLRNETMLKNYVSVISNPKSAYYHHYLTQAQLQAVFSPAPATYAAVQQYLQQSGFTITQTYTHRLLIGFSGTVSQAEQAFHVQIDNYVGPDGEKYYANTTDPSLPASLAGAVQMISGLDNAAHWSHGPLPTAKQHVATSNASPLFCPGSGGSSSNYYTASQYQTAYNVNPLYSEGNHGEGQTIALFELDTFQMSDITNYENCYSHNSHPHIYTIQVDNGVPTDKGVFEVELDAELVLGMDWGLGQLRIYEASNDSTGYNEEWSRILQDNPPVISTSWGICEQDANPSNYDAEAQDFLYAAAQGETIYAASGDTGSAACMQVDSKNTSLGVQDPASQQYITSVGGTTLSINGDSSYNSEAVWNDQYGSSGGGISSLWTELSQMNAPGVHNGYSTNATCGASSGQICREVPDVSLSAKDYLVYCTSQVALCEPNGPWWIAIGTSAAAPMWAAMTTLVNEQSLKSGGFTMGWITPLLYEIASNSTDYSRDFHDILNGNNDFCGCNNGDYPAVADYDLATGLGSYDAANLAQDLIALNGQRAPTPANTQWYFAEGAVGGDFAEYLTLQNPSATQTANVTITYLLQNHTPSIVTKQRTVNPSTRVTVIVNDDLGIQPPDPKVSLAAIVTSDQPIVAERPMYFSFHGVKSGTDVVGATSAHTTYYFPYGNTAQSGSTHDSTYITMLNPSTTNTAHVTLTYYTNSCGASGQPACPTETLPLAPQARGTASPSDAGVGLAEPVSIAVSSDQPIVAERPMYANASVPNAGPTTGAASEVGATSPGTDWLFAEGSTQPKFQEYLNLANFGTTAATATINLEYTNGDVRTQQVSVPAASFTQFDVNAANGSCNPSPCNPTQSVSAEVTSDQPIVVDRLMYFHYHGSISGITEVVGTPAAQSIYAFAEGYTGGQFTEYLTVQNPTNNAETVSVTLFTQKGLVLEEYLIVDAHSRGGFTINNVLNPIGPDSVSLVVQALENGAVIVAERPEYFSYGILNTKLTATGATDVIGYTGS